MPMIYNPAPGEWPLLVELRRALTAGVEQAAILAAVDFIAQRNQPWALYAGVAAGVTAAACGLPGGAATLYVIGDMLDFYVLKSPQGSTVVYRRNQIDTDEEAVQDFIQLMMRPWYSAERWNVRPCDARGAAGAAGGVR